VAEGAVKQLKQGLHIRGDSLYCPLAFSLDSYGNCEADCTHCYLRRLNEVWGKDLKPLDVENFQRTLHNGLKNNNPKSPLAYAIKFKKTLRFGNKTDPFQDAEKKHLVSLAALETLRDLKWPVVIETKYTDNIWHCLEILKEMKSHLHVMPIISPGFDKDWEIFENKKTTRPTVRLNQLRGLKGLGIRVGVNGEPFIPGYHQVSEFEDMMKRLKDNGIPSYNVYNLHFNAFVAKRLHAVGVDIEKVWYYNRDEHWKPILQQLIDLALKYDIILGSPDFVNSGWKFWERSNTCCGVNVDNPCTWNVMTWKRMIQTSVCTVDQFLKEEWYLDTWDGVGDYNEGVDVLYGVNKDRFSLDDIK
jgi:DNA repair photolyase